MALFDRFRRRRQPSAAASGPALETLVAEALRRHQAGDLAAAESGYRAALALAPERAELNYLLGSALGQRGRLAEAAERLEAALAAQPDLVEAHAVLGNVRRAAADAAGAAAAWERALELDPACLPARRGLAHLRAERADRRGARELLRGLIEEGSASGDDHFLAGNLAMAEGEPARAVAHYREALAAGQSSGELHGNLGVALERSGDPQAALAAQRRAIELAPGLADAHYNAGLLEVRAGRLAQALPDFRSACERMPSFLAARRQHALVRIALGETEAGLEELERLRDEAPEGAEIWFDIASAQAGCGRLAAAEGALRAALERDPEHARAAAELGHVLARRGRIGEAVTAIEQALALDSTLVEAHNNLGGVRQMQADLDGAIACYQEALALAPGRLDVRSNLLACRNYHPDAARAEILSDLRAWRDAAAGPAAGGAGPLVGPDPDRRLRIGYLSPDLRTHSVAYFLAPLLEAHDAAAVETVAFSAVATPDATTARLRQIFAEWHDVTGLDDAQAAALVRERRIDVLVDLAGHTLGNRLGVMARRPAPVQATYLGYPASTGLEVIDYRLTDAVADPPGDDAEYAESLVRLPRPFLAYRPPRDAPPLPERAAVVPGEVTFVSFNELPKVSDPVVAAWAAILRRLPAARLLIKGSALADAGTARRLAGRFEAHGIARERLRLEGRTERLAEHLARYACAHIGLDTFPYNGATTTCEALWMGVPVVSLAGERHAGRVGASLLGALGLEALVAASSAAYVEAAVDLAGDPDRLVRLGRSLRERMMASALLDATSLAREVEAAYRAGWRRWCAGPGRVG